MHLVIELNGKMYDEVEDAKIVLSAKGGGKPTDYSFTVSRQCLHMAPVVIVFIYSVVEYQLLLGPVHTAPYSNENG